MSNSFLYLTEQIRFTHKITFNKRYADHLLVAGYTQSYEETLVNEIRCLDRSAIVKINIKNRDFEITLRDYEENTADIDSAEGIKILDAWYDKWTTVIRNLKQRTNNISVDLSGGFDSRVAFTLFLGSGINLNEIRINSNPDDLHCHPADFEIASEIADHYGFTLNSNKCLDMQTMNYSQEDCLNICMYQKLGLHNLMYWKTVKFDTMRYAFTGSGAVRGLRLHGWQSESELIETQMHNGQYYGNEVAASARDILTDSFSAIKKKYAYLGREIPPEDICYYLYRETRNRVHYGKDMAEQYYANRITFSPLLDAGLQRLKHSSEGCGDSSLLMAVIFDRFQKDLLNFKFEGGRSIQESTIAYARNLNRKYPRTATIPNQIQKAGLQPAKPIAESSEVPDSAAIECANKRLTYDDMRGLIKQAMFSPEIKDTFESLYSAKAFQRQARRWETDSFHPDANAYSIIAISRVYQDCRISQAICREDSIADYLIEQSGAVVSSEQMRHQMYEIPYFKQLATARLDLKNAGNDTNSLELQSLSDARATVQTPDWFNSNGKGYVIQSDCGMLDLQMKCIGAGTLRMALRGIFKRDIAGNRVHVWIDCRKFAVNSQEKISQTRTVSHDRAYSYEKDVEDGEIVTIHVEWEPHDELLEKNPLQQKLEQDLADKIKELEDLKSELSAALQAQEEIEQKQQKLREQLSGMQELLQ